MLIISSEPYMTFQRVIQPEWGRSEYYDFLQKSGRPVSGDTRKDAHRSPLRRLFARSAK